MEIWLDVTLLIKFEIVIGTKRRITVRDSVNETGNINF